MIKRNYEEVLNNIIKTYFPNISVEEIEENKGFFKEIVDGLPKNKIKESEGNFPLFELTFTDKNNFMYKVYYYSHLYDKDNVFKKVTLDNEEYFSILDRDNSYCTYSKERSYYCGKHVWEKSDNPEFEKIIYMFIYLYGPEILCDEKKLIKKK